MSKQKSPIAKLHYISMNDSAKSNVEKEDFVEDSPLRVGNKDSSKQEVKKARFSLPSVVKNLPVISKLNSEKLASPDLRFLPDSGSQEESKFNPNSLTSIFSGDKDKASGINRVFRKSVIFLGIQLVVFLAFIIFSINFFSSIFFALAFLIINVAVSNIFYIIVADRSYMWLSLLGQAFSIILVNSFLGLGFNLPTLIVTLFVVLLNFLAYSELEKVQLSSRLFSISHITGESTRILLTASIFLTALNLFNGIIYEGNKTGQKLGTQPFLSRVLFTNKLIMDNILIGQTESLSVNNRVMKGSFYISSADNNSILIDGSSVSVATTRQATFSNFLEENYKFSSVLSDADQTLIETQKCTTPANSPECNLVLSQEKISLLEQWRLESYSNLPYTLETPLNIGNFRLITEQYYLNIVSGFESEKPDSTVPIDTSLLFLPPTTIIPAFIAFLLMIGLFFTRFLLNWIVQITSWIIWKILAFSGFVQIEVETVEAEIVSI
jgi:hypothetical protein